MAALALDSRRSAVGSGQRATRGSRVGDLPFILHPSSFLLLFCLASLVVLPGCGGCRKTPAELAAEREKQEAERRAREREKEKRKKKPDVEFGNLVSLPHESNPDSCACKPGHWTATTLPAKANNFNLLGDLEMTVVNRRADPIGLVGMAYTSTASRQVALPKGQQKLLQSVVYVPARGGEAFVSGRIDALKGGRGAYEKPPLLLTRMPSYQYHFAVLARWPQSYKYLDSLDSAKNPSDLRAGDADLAFYRVQLLQAEKQTTLPRSALFWTSIAYVLWDDAELGALLPEQQEALLDWLHWGGGLIISGPDSLDSLRNSFLAPYLPATSAGTRQLTEADFEELNARWTLAVGQKSGRRLTPVGPWAGVQFDVHPQARAVPGTGGLLVERRAGRGRIVVSAFELDHPELTRWPSFDGFFNACLLGRPPREFIDQDLEIQVTWFDGKGVQPDGTVGANKSVQLDPRRVCKLRYFSRDTGTKMTTRPQEDNRLSYALGTLAYSGEGSPYDDGPGVASWNDFNSVANSARVSLQNAARIEIPERTFVVWVLGAYLLVLVPVNWIVFRSIGRVEWAWAAAPVIAIVYTLLVIRLAQLDIGFARSSTEIAVVELQGDYPRGHVTRYTALYTSLATAYEFRFEDPGAQLQPFPTVQAPEMFKLLPGQGLTKLQYRYDRDVRMRGFHVTSNTTGLVHSEQMANLGGPISLTESPGGGYQVTNGTAFTLHGAGVIRRNEGGRLETAWIGTLEPQLAASLRFRPMPETDVAARSWADERNRSPVTVAGAAKGQLNFRQLVDLAEDPEKLRPGDVQLTGWFDKEIPGLEVKPAAPQSRRAALVVAHLRYGYGEDPRPDVNTRREKETDGYRVVEPDSLEAEPR